MCIEGIKKGSTEAAGSAELRKRGRARISVLFREPKSIILMGCCLKNWVFAKKPRQLSPQFRAVGSSQSTECATTQEKKLTLIGGMRDVVIVPFRFSIRVTRSQGAAVPHRGKADLEETPFCQSWGGLSVGCKPHLKDGAAGRVIVCPAISTLKAWPL
jgi:hypothetical protein